MNYYVYILSNATRTTLYVGVTRDLVRRMNIATNWIREALQLSTTFII